MKTYIPLKTDISMWLFTVSIHFNEVFIQWFSRVVCLCKSKNKAKASGTE